MNIRIDLPDLLWWQWLLSGGGAGFFGLILMAIATTNKRVRGGMVTSLAGLSIVAAICCVLMGIWQLFSSWNP